MTTVYVFMLTCLANCGVLAEAPYYSDRVFYSRELCEESGKNTAINLWLTTKKEYGYKCVIAAYTPKKLP